LLGLAQGMQAISRAVWVEYVLAPAGLSNSLETFENR